jgi:hypothetical protein
MDCPAKRDSPFFAHAPENFPSPRKTACKTADFMLYYFVLAGMAEWQTRRTQNPLAAMSCGFKSHFRHDMKNPNLTFQLEAGSDFFLPFHLEIQSLSGGQYADAV